MNLSRAIALSTWLEAETPLRLPENAKKLLEGLQYEENFLKPVDLKRLRQHGIERKRATLARWAERVGRVLMGGSRHICRVMDSMLLRSL